MNGFSRLALVEGKLFLREKAALLGVFGLPVGLVVGFGLIPGFSDPQKGLSDQIGTEYIAAVGVAIVLASLGLTGVPMVLGQYRERGVLRRLGVTPVRPLALLLADLTVWAAAAVLSVTVVVAVVRFAFHVPAPVEAGWFVLSVVLGIASLFAVGLLAAAAGNRRREGGAVTVRTPDSGFESLERRYDSILRVLPYLLLAVPLLPYALSQSPSAGAFGITVGVAAGGGGLDHLVRRPASRLGGAPSADGRLLHRPARVHCPAHRAQPLVRVLQLVRLHARVPVPDRRVAVGGLRARGARVRRVPGRRISSSDRLARSRSGSFWPAWTSCSWACSSCWA